MLKQVAKCSCGQIVGCKCDNRPMECRGCDSFSICKERFEQTPELHVTCTACAIKSARPTVKHGDFLRGIA